MTGCLFGFCQASWPAMLPNEITVSFENMKVVFPLENDFVDFLFICYVKNL